MTSSSKSTTKKSAKGSTKVANPNSTGGKGFIWAILALLLVGALVIGLIVYNGRGAMADRIAENVEPVDGVTMELTDNTVTLSGENSDGAKEASIYEDFGCYYCSELAKKTDEQMLEKIKAGELKVHIHPMVFLDGTAEKYKPAHSTNTLAAALALADKGEVEPYWNMRKALLEEQENLAGVTPDQLADIAKSVGASKGAVEAIRNSEYMDQAKELGEANEKDLVDKTGDLSSPRVLVDGKDVESNPLENWIDDLLAS